MMINVDISNVWSAISLPELLEIEREVHAAHSRLLETAADRTWLDLPERMQGAETEEILNAARKIRRESDACVVVGTGGSCLGARAVMELLQGPGRNLRKEGPRIFFAGDTLSTRHWNELTGLLEGTDFSVIVISESGTAPEPAIAFRGLRWLLERRYGTDEAAKRIYVVTAPEKGALRQMAAEERWTCFDMPAGVEDRFSLLSPAGLLPMAMAGIDITEVLQGALEAGREYDLRSFENPLWLYAGVRNALYRKGIGLELLESGEPGFRCFGCWWQQLFAAAADEEGCGIFPVPAELYGMDRLIRQGRSGLFETMICFDGPEKTHTIGSGWKDLDGLKALEGKTLDAVERMAFSRIVADHEAAGLAVITMDCGELTDRKAGELIWFFQLACGICTRIMGTGALDLPGAENC